MVREQGYAGFTIFADVVMKDGKMVNLSTKGIKYSQVPNARLVWNSNGRK